MVASLWPILCTAQLGTPAQREVDALLRAVGTSGCQFIRGGTTYSSGQALEHLQKKYEYMAARDMLVSTEEFIEKAATRSSMSGEPYLLRCGDTPPQRSEDWLKARLRSLRQSPAPK